MLRLLPIIVVLAWTQIALASGWHDYRLQIDPDFQIVRANSLEVALCRPNGGVVLYPLDYPGVGPICGYTVTPSHILTRHHGRTRLNRFEGDTFEDVDETKQYYFITSKPDGEVLGPFDEPTFLSLPTVRAVGPVSWVKPRNPNIVAPLVGSLMALGVAAVVFAVPIVWLLLVIALAWAWLRRRRRSRPRAV